jgi:hypothetical protein
MTVPTHSALVLKGKCPCSLVIHTTLYDLIGAIHAAVGAGEDALVIACVVYLLETQRLTFLGAPEPRRLVTAHRPAPRRRRQVASIGCRRANPVSALGTPSSRPRNPTRYGPSIGPRRPPATA